MSTLPSKGTVRLLRLNSPNLLSPSPLTTNRLPSVLNDAPLLAVQPGAIAIAEPTSKASPTRARCATYKAPARTKAKSNSSAVAESKLTGLGPETSFKISAPDQDACSLHAGGSGLAAPALSLSPAIEEAGSL